MYMSTPKPHTLTPSHPHILTLNPHLHIPTHPHTLTPHSGGTNYTITGTGLNSVQQPRLLFYMEGAAREGRRRRQTAGQNMNYIQSEVSMEHTNQILSFTEYCNVIIFSVYIHL